MNVEVTITLTEDAVRRQLRVAVEALGRIAERDGSSGTAHRIAADALDAMLAIAAEPRAIKVTIP